MFGLLPLFSVIAFSIAQYVPAYQERRALTWSSWLSSRLGVDVQIAAVEPLARIVMFCMDSSCRIQNREPRWTHSIGRG